MTANKAQKASRARPVAPSPRRRSSWAASGNLSSAVSPADRPRTRQTEYFPQALPLSEASASHPRSKGDALYQVAAAAADADEPTEFQFTLYKQSASSSCGWKCDLLDPERLYIHAVSSRDASPVMEYNTAAPKALRVRDGDYIVSVNGVRGDSAALQRELGASAVLSLVLRRPQLRRLSFQKAGRRPGLFVKYASQGSTCLWVQRLVSGAIAESGIDIVEGDRITSVCGVAGDPQAMLEALRASDPVDLVVVRPA
mmetsp:Transcript_51245/g.149079  ORF Transcript_51245/g.149079 Transcript_51245/m.149079 type:complete len:256 (-) Transcript_51245:204-971(-)